MTMALAHMFSGLDLHDKALPQHLLTAIVGSIQQML